MRLIPTAVIALLLLPMASTFASAAPCATSENKPFCIQLSVTNLATRCEENEAVVDCWVSGVSHATVSSLAPSAGTMRLVTSLGLEFCDARGQDCYDHRSLITQYALCSWVASQGCGTSSPFLAKTTYTPDCYWSPMAGMVGVASISGQVGQENPRGGFVVIQGKSSGDRSEPGGGMCGPQ